MGSSEGEKAPSGGRKKAPLGRILQKLRKRHIIETLAAFIGGGWLILEFVHWLLVDHYHFPEKTIDIAFVTILAALVCTLLWRWFSGREQPRKFKLELILIPLVLLIAVLLDVNLLLHLKAPESEAVPPSKLKNSIAVLPFIDMSPQKDQEYFCDGMTEELIKRLSNIKDIKVPASTSAFFFKGKASDIREVGQKLKVEKVLEGSVRKAGNELRITAQLVNIADGYHLWSETYDQKLKDIFAIQDDIAQKIINALKIEVLEGDQKQFVKRYTENRDVYDLYLKGRYYWNKRGKSDLLKAIEYFKETVNNDPSFALGYSGMGLAYVTLGSNEFYPSNEVFPIAKDAALKALKLDQGLDEAHIALGDVFFWYERDFSASEREFKRALDLNPGNADAHHWYAHLLIALGRKEEAIKESFLARDLDPLAPRKNADLGNIFFLARDYPKAVEELEKSKEMFPEHARNYYYLAKLYAQMGKHKEAIESILHISSHPESAPVLAYVYGNSGEKERALAIIGDILKSLDQQFFSPLLMSEAYVAIGDKNQAFYWLDKAYTDIDYALSLLKVIPEFDPLRPDPRFTELLKKIGLEK